MLSYKSRMENTIPRASVFLYSVLAICYGLLLSSWPNEYFRDRFSYITYANNVDEVADRYNSISLFFNEPLFIYYNSFLRLFFTPEVVPQVGVFFIASTCAYFILRYAYSYFMILVGFSFLFFISYTFHLQLIVLRQGIATALFLWFIYLFFEKKYFLVLVFILSFFHSSFFIISAMLIFEKILSVFIKKSKLKIVVFSIALLLLGFIILKIAVSLGVRQAEGEYLSSVGSGGGGFILFSFIFIFLYFRGIDNVEKNRFGKVALLGVISYLAFYFTIPISGRLIGTFLPFYYIYVVSCFNSKVHFSAYILFIISIILFAAAITGGSLTYVGVEKFNSILSFLM
ncbi:EpsG family protein [Vibrio hibernica]|uniref:EpsG family protein n=1 Tax=Vibrio hibernica TaxID=2587465 RepID=UPI0039B0C7AE